MKGSHDLLRIILLVHRKYGTKEGHNCHCTIDAINKYHNLWDRPNSSRSDHQLCERPITLFFRDHAHKLAYIDSINGLFIEAEPRP